MADSPGAGVTGAVFNNIRKGGCFTSKRACRVPITLFHTVDSSVTVLFCSRNSRFSFSVSHNGLTSQVVGMIHMRN